MTLFKELGLSDEVLKALDKLGFEKPTEIQEQAIPTLLKGENDFIGLAQTGTGKTAAFGLPLLELLDPNSKDTQALILAPTRELGQQIAEQIHLYSKFLDKINVLCVYGGAAISNQIKALKKTQHIIVATPGRLIDLIERKAIRLNHVNFVILDEADEMLNMGFKEDLDHILSFTPDTKLTWLFSATMPREIKRIVHTYMESPDEVRINPKNEINANIEHQFAVVTRSNKSEALTRFLDVQPDMRGVVFCRTKRDTQELAEILLTKNYKADALHGDLSQAQRDRVMKRFKSHELQVLIATDVAARGIDVNDLTHVVHYSLPDDTAYYTHRSGRTARAGKKGISLVFINGREKRRVGYLENDLGISFEHVQIPHMEDIAQIRIQNWCQDVLDQEVKATIAPDIEDYVNLKFVNLTREELAMKLLARELELIDLSQSADLNEQIEKGGRGDGGRGRSRDRGRGGRRDGGGDRRGRGGDRRGRGGDSRSRGGGDSRSRGGGDSRSRGGESRNRRDRKDRFHGKNKSNDSSSSSNSSSNSGVQFEGRKRKRKRKEF